MNISINQDKTAVLWAYKGKSIKINEYNILEVKYIEKEGLVLIIYEVNDSTEPYLTAYSLDGSMRFQTKSSDDLAIYRFSSHLDDQAVVVGSVKENGLYIDYHFGVDMKNGALTKYGRAY